MSSYPRPFLCLSAYSSDPRPVQISALGPAEAASKFGFTRFTEAVQAGPVPCEIWVYVVEKKQGAIMRMYRIRPRCEATLEPR